VLSLYTPSARTCSSTGYTGSTLFKAELLPRYAVKLTPAGPLVAPMTEFRSAPAFPFAQRSWGVAHTPVHMFRYPVCNKRFERQVSDFTLRPHKTPQGRNQGGRRRSPDLARPTRWCAFGASGCLAVIVKAWSTLTRLYELLARHPLPPAKILHGYAAVSESLS